MSSSLSTESSQIKKKNENKVTLKPTEKLQLLFKYWWRVKDIIQYLDVDTNQAYKIRKNLRSDQICKYNGDLVLRDAVLEEYLHSNKEKEVAIQLEQIEIEKRLFGVITNG